MSETQSFSQQENSTSTARAFVFDGGAGDYFVVLLLATLLTFFTVGIGFP